MIFRENQIPEHRISPNSNTGGMNTEMCTILTNEIPDLSENFEVCNVNGLQKEEEGKKRFKILY